MINSKSFEERKQRMGKYGAWLRSVCLDCANPESHLSGVHNPRAVLADLRRGLNGSPQLRGPMWKHVAPYLGEYDHPTDRWFFVVGALAAWHPQIGAPAFQSFGTAARVLHEKSDSAADRFAALLACDERDLPQHLRQITGLLAASDIPVNWLQLLQDMVLTQWSHPERKVQSKWARDFYRDRYSDTDAQQEE